MRQKISLWRVVLALCVVLGGFRPQSAQAMIQCQGDHPEFFFKTATAQTKYIKSKSAADLTQMHGGGAGVVGGLGGGEIGFQTEARFEVRHQNGAACIALKQLSVVFYAKPTVHVASNFGRSSCEYNAVMGHEKKHISTLLKFVREYSPKAKSHIARILETTKSAYGPMPMDRVQAAQKKIQKDLATRIEAFADQVMPVLSKRQQEIDNPDEYARVAAQCGQWDKKLGMKDQGQ